MAGRSRGFAPMTAESQNAEQDSSAESNLKVRLGSWHDIARSGLFKFVALGVSAVLGIIITRIIITNFGTDVFAQYGLLVGIGALLPVGILGVDAPIVNGVATSNDPKADAKLQTNSSQLDPATDAGRGHSARHRLVAHGPWSLGRDSGRQSDSG